VAFGGDHVIFEHLYVHDITGIGPAIYDHGIYREKAEAPLVAKLTDMTIRNVRIENSFGEAIYVMGIYPVWLKDEGFRKIAVNGTSGLTIEHVVIKNSGVNGGQGDGIDCKEGITNLTVRDCDISGFSGMAGIIVPRSVEAGVDQHILIERCHIHHAAAAGEARKAIYGGAEKWFSLRGITVRNCVVHSVPTGIALYRSDKDGKTSDITVVNNTVYDVQDSGLGVQADNAVVMNNLLFGNDGGKVQAHISGKNVRSDYNAYCGSLISPAEGKNTIVLTDQQVAQLKADVAKNASTLPSTAAVVDKGTALEGFSDDIRGVKRPQGADWDIGAYEYATPAETQPAAK
jgi:hypothetical protein